MNSPGGKRGEKTPSQQKVKVICRVRPFLEEELSDDAVRVYKNTIKITNQRNTSEDLIYSFNSCYGPASTQADIFDADVRPMLNSVFRGMNTTIFAYGVTGSGKTFTMQGTSSEPGIIPRTVQTLFKIKAKSKMILEYSLSYIEIYKEIIYDLLIPREMAPTGGLSIREDSHKNIFLPNITEKKINSYDEFLRTYSAACKNRSTAATRLNVLSSRSHADMCIYVSCRNSDTDEITVGKVHLIDLAGSEDNRRTENGKERIAESGAINKSLFALNQVVEALNQGLSRIPYRDSKLTRILQDSLGGRSLSMIIINISPGQSFYMDTYNTLNFAKRTKEIENKPQVNYNSRPPLPPKFQLGITRFPMKSKDEPKPKRQRLSDPTDTKNSNSNSSKTERLSDSVLMSMNSSWNNANYKTEELSYHQRVPLSEKQIQDIEEKIRHNLDQRLENKFKEVKQQMLSPIVHKQNENLNQRIKVLEQKLETKKDPQLANLLTPETKTKTARALVALAKAHETQNELEDALESYQTAFAYIPDNLHLVKKINTIKEAIINGKQLKTKKRKTQGDTTTIEQRQDDQMSDTASVSQACSTSSNAKPLAIPVPRSLASPIPRSVWVKCRQDRQLIEAAKDENSDLSESAIVTIINTGALRQIRGLKGIGPKRAETILEFIKQNGPIDELSNLRHAGITEKVLARIVKENIGRSKFAHNSFNGTQDKCT
ncbi:hypothetical protein G9A89_009301 [Geosiphon pyriformis]|nr:hypothetical protein G9A89_009301 [Geosiphon pyriformis]